MAIDDSGERRSGLHKASAAFLQVPSWVDVAQLVKTLGIATIFACVLLYFFLQVYALKLDAIEAAIKANTDASEAHTRAVSNMNSLLERHDMTGQLTLWVLQVMCINEATSPAERERCLSRPDSR
jgi:hypothetical protein